MKNGSGELPKDCRGGLASLSKEFLIRVPDDHGARDAAYVLQDVLTKDWCFSYMKHSKFIMELKTGSDRADT